MTPADRAGSRAIGLIASRMHWREYAIEAGALAAFMISAVAFAAVLEHSASPVREAIPNAVVRRAVTGIGMGLTAASIIYSPWGRRSGAHLNPSVTLTFLRLGRIAPRDAAFYVLAQFVGAAGGLLLASTVLRDVASDPSVNYIATMPGAAGAVAAFAGELTISFVMMGMILVVANRQRLARYTGALAACLIAFYITVEAPLSGMSMNPARTLAPAVAAGSLESLWIYFIAPPAGMLLAAELYVRRYGHAAVRCAKLHHPRHGACHFNCASDGVATRPELLAPARLLTRPS